MTQPGIEPGYSTVMLESLDEMKADAHLAQPGLIPLLLLQYEWVKQIGLTSVMQKGR
jgi:hypothetical protein